MKQVQEPSKTQGQVKGQVQCLDCKYLNLRASPRHSRTGWAQCDSLTAQVEGSAFMMIRHERDCGEHEPVPYLVAGRVRWLENNRYVPTAAKEQTK